VARVQQIADTVEKPDAEIASTCGIS
jgi:hypothetical protein